MPKLCIKKSIERVNSQCETTGKKKKKNWTNSVLTGISRHCSEIPIKTITRNQYRSPMLEAAVTLGKATPATPGKAWYRPTYKTCSLHLRVTQSPKVLPEGGHFVTFLQTITSTRRAAHLHVSHEITRIPRECPEDFSKTSKHFSREIFQREDDSSIEITSKIIRHLMHKSSTISSSLLY